MSRKISAILLSVACVLTYIRLRLIEVPNVEVVSEAHQQVIEGTAYSPEQYRVLVPFLVEGLTQLQARVIPYDIALLLSYTYYYFFAYALLLAFLYQLCRQWYSPEMSLIGVLFAGCVIPLTFLDHHFQPWTPLEAALFALSLLLIIQKQYVLLAVIIALATLNRETAVFIPLAAAAAEFPTVREAIAARKGLLDWLISPTIRRIALRLIAYGAIWVLIFVGLRVVRPETTRFWTVSSIWGVNSDPSYLIKAVLQIALFLGVWWWFAIKGVRQAPPFLRYQSLIVVPPFLVLIAIFAIWHEVRVLAMLYPILIPLGLAYLQPEIKLDEQAAL